MSGNGKKIKAEDVESELFRSSAAFRRRAIVRRRLMERNCRMTDEEADHLIRQEAVVKEEFKRYMREEIGKLHALVQKIEGETVWWKRQKLIRWLLDDLKPLLPDLIDLLK